MNIFMHHGAASLFNRADIADKNEITEEITSDDFHF